MINLIGNSHKCYIKYKNLIFWIKSYGCKHFFSNQLYMSSDKKSLGSSIQLLSEFSIINIDLNIAQAEKKISKATFILMSANTKISS